jgi:hypothetical protein
MNWPTYWIMIEGRIVLTHMSKRSEYYADRLRSLRCLVGLTLLFQLLQPPTTTVVAQLSNAPKCVAADKNDREPWEHNDHVLAQFPPDEPLPVFMGRFVAPDASYELDLWRDRVGLFGQWVSPVLGADSPTSRLYDLTFDAKSGAISFATRIPGAGQRFEGRVSDQLIRGTSTLATGKKETIELRKLPLDSLGVALRDGTTSRAGFECEMVLFRRY